MKFLLGVLAGVLALAAAIRLAPARTMIEEQSVVLDKPVNDQEEALEYDQTIGADHSMVELRPIHLGDLSVPCAICDTEVDLIQVGLGSVEDRETEGGDFNDITQLGVVYYLCGHVIYSSCLVDRVAEILNAEEIGQLAPKLFDNITYCKTHSEDHALGDDEDDD